MIKLAPINIFYFHDYNVTFSDPDFVEEVYESIHSGVDLLSYSQRIPVSQSLQHKKSRYYLFTRPINDASYWERCIGRNKEKRKYR